MKKLIIITAFTLAAASTALSQTAADALRYSKMDIGGTARYMGLSGAFGALGADFTLTSTNPAGIGLYKSSEFIFTPAVHTGSVASSQGVYNGSDSRTNFYLGNVGFVMTSKTKSNPNKPGWRFISFATGLNRVADYNASYDMAEMNGTNSLLDTYVNSADGINFHNIEDDPNGDYGFDLNLAWWDWLLDLQPTPDSSTYFSPIPAGVDKLQTKHVDTWGSMNEYVLSLGANYNDRLYLGMTMGVPYIRYYESSHYREANIVGTDLKYFDRFEDLETHGSGFNIKLGFICRPTEWLRLGAAFHSPSWFGNMRDYWTATMVSEFYTPDNNGDYKYVRNSPSGYYEYNLQTPYHVMGNLAFIIGNVGLISADYDMVDYSKAQFDAYDYSFGEENASIRNSYKIAHNFRFGTEWRYNIFSFRAGARYSTSPYQNSINDGSLYGFSGGVGFKQNWFFMDLAYAYTNTKSDYYYYNTGGIYADPISNKLRSHSVVLTLGVKM
jgi:hypothetical protein